MNLGKLCTGIKCTWYYIIVIIVTEIIVIIEVVTAAVPAVIAALYISSETIELSQISNRSRTVSDLLPWCRTQIPHLSSSIQTRSWPRS